MDNEIKQKITLVRELAERQGVGAILLQRVSSAAWLTGGASTYINTASSAGEASLLVTAQEHYLLTNNIEAPRLEQEEKLKEQGWNFQVAPWFEKNPALEELTKGTKLGSDGLFPGVLDLSAEMARLRANLTPEEGQRFRELGKLCAEAVENATHSVKPGQSEHEIGSMLAFEAERRGVQATVILVATDERIFNFRHPLPTHKKLDRYAMLIICGRRQGLVCSLTRLVHFGRLPEEIRHKAEAVAHIDADMIAATRPGKTLGDVFQVTMDGYARHGFDGEWRLHHQGGPAGYEPREYVGTPGSSDRVLEGQVYAWNPSITGSKSEDSFLVGKDENEILTSMPGWPVYSIEVGGRMLERPAILEIKD